MTDTSILEAITSTEETSENEDLKDFEDIAHSHNVLFSSDALRFVLSQNGNSKENLNRTIELAKNEYPVDDGWVIVNLSRVEALLKEGEAQKKEVPKTEETLTEAILSGHLEKALELSKVRPMLTLAEAAANIDKMYREAVAKREDMEAAKLKNIIDALATALDGTNSNEEEAVMKAVEKAVEILDNF